MRERSVEQSRTPRTIAIAVECYAGHRGEETPRVIRLGAGDGGEINIGSRRIAVVEVLDRWLAPEHRYFKLRGDDGDVYIVRHDVIADAWELTMFARG